jgi:hypothetical protein
MTDLTALSTQLTTLATSISDIGEDTTDLFTAVNTLKTGVQGQIDTAVADADANVIIPVMAMYTNQQLMANSLANINASFITLITPEA